MSDPKDLNSEWCQPEKVYAVVAHATPEFGPERLEFNDVAAAGTQIVVDGGENPHCRLSVNGAKFREVPPAQ